MKEHLVEVAHIKKRKEKFKALSQMWENEKADLVTVHADYLVGLNKTIADLRREAEGLRLENGHLREVVQILEDLTYPCV